MTANKLKISPKFLTNLLLFFFCIYPISFLLGNFAINLFLFIFNIIVFFGIFKKYFSYKILDNYIFKLLIALFLFFIINLFFSNNIVLSYPRVLKFILIIGSILAFRALIYYCSNSDINKMYKIWSAIFLVVLIDIFFELIVGSNILGFKSIIPGRVSSFTGNEMNIGHFFSAFCLIFFSFKIFNYKNNFISLIIAISLIVVSFLIGERSNFIRSLLIILIFVFFIKEIKFKYKLLSISTLIILFISIINFNPNYKVRYFQQFTEILTKKGLNYYLDNSIYGAHFEVAKKIFKENKTFGIGIKNFRVESFSDEYNIKHKYNERRGNTHPHQVHYEFLSETGLVGYFSFLLFIIGSFYLAIKTYLKNKNLFQLSAMLYVFVSLIPLLPTGSFFSTYSSSLFWLNYAIMVGYINNSSKVEN